MHMLLPLVDFLNHSGDETECFPGDRAVPTANVRYRMAHVLLCEALGMSCTQSMRCGQNEGAPYMRTFHKVFHIIVHMNNQSDQYLAYKLLLTFSHMHHVLSTENLVVVMYCLGSSSCL